MKNLFGGDLHATRVLSLPNSVALRELVPPPLRIPTQGGQVFRFDRGQRSDLMAATIPI